MVVRRSSTSMKLGSSDGEPLVPDIENPAPAPFRVGAADGAARLWRRTIMATTELQAIVRFRFYDGHLEEFKRLSAQCMEIVRTQDTGTLQYDTYFNDDETDASSSSGSVTLTRSSSTDGRNHRHGIGDGRAPR
jgi:hypothetical protein